MGDAFLVASVQAFRGEEVPFLEEIRHQSSVDENLGSQVEVASPSLIFNLLTRSLDRPKRLI